MDKYHDLLKTSEESEGTAQRKYEAYQESIEAWTKKLQAAWEELANDSNINEFIKTILKVSTGLVKALPVIIRYGSRLLTMLNAYKMPGFLKMMGGFLGLKKGGGVEEDNLSSRTLAGRFYAKRQLNANRLNGDPLNAGVHELNTTTDSILQILRDIRTEQQKESGEKGGSSQGVGGSGKKSKKKTSNTSQETNKENTGTNTGDENKEEQNSPEKKISTVGTRVLTGVATGLVAGMNANTTSTTLEGENYEMSSGAKWASRAITAGVTGVATALGGPIAGMIASSLADVFTKYVIGPIIDKDKIEREETAKRSQQIIEAMENIHSTLDSIASSMKNVSEWTAEEYKEWSKALDSIIQSLIESDNENALNEFQTVLISKLERYFGDGLNLEKSSIRDIFNYFSDNEENIPKLYDVLEQTQAQVNAQEILGANAERLHQLNQEISGKDAVKNLTKWSGEEIWDTISSYTNTISMFIDLGQSIKGSRKGTFARVSQGKQIKEAYLSKETNEEKIAYLQEMLATDLSEGQREKFKKQLGVLTSAIAEEKEIMSKADKASMEAAILSAQNGGVFLKNASQDYLKILGKENIKKAIIDEAVSYYAEDEREAARTRIEGDESLFKSLINENDNLNAFWSGKNFTLSEAINWGDEEILENFAAALETTTEQLKDSSEIIEKWSDFTLGNLTETTAQLEERLSKLSEVVSTLSSGYTNASKLQEEIIKNYPQMINLLGDSEKLATKLIDYIAKNIELLAKNKFEDILTDLSYFNQNWDTIRTKIQKSMDLSDEDFEKKVMEDMNLSKVTNGSKLIEWYNSWNGYVMNGKPLDFSSLKEDLEDIYGTLDLVLDEWNSLVDLALDYQQKVLDNQISNLNAQKEQLQKITQEREYENKLIQARLDLENAQKDKKRVWREGLGFVYEADQGSILEKQKNLESIENEQIISKLDVQIEELQSIKNSIESFKTDADFENLKTTSESLGETLGAKGSIVNIIQKLKENFNKPINGKNLLGSEFQTDEEKSEVIMRSAQDSYKTFMNRAAGKAARGNAAANFQTAYNSLSEENQNLVRDTVGQEAFSQMMSPNPTDEYNLDIFDKIITIDGDRYHVEDGLSAQYDQWMLKDSKNRKGYYSPWEVKIGSSIDQHDAGWTNIKKRDVKNLSSIKEFIDKEKLKNRVMVAADGSAEYIYIDNYGIPHDLSYEGVAENALGNLSFAGGPTLLNEFGTEAIITPQGTVTSLPSKSGILPADITTNLWRLGEISPTILKAFSPNNSLDRLQANSMVNDESFNINTLTMNVEADDSFNVDAFVRSIQERVALTKNKR